MKDAENITADFEAWCDEQDESCPVVCMNALSLMKEQRTENKIIMGNNAELDKQRTAFAMKIEELKTEIERLKPQEGHWIRTGEKNCYGGTVAVCSCCEDKIVFSDISLEKYCRSCGAKMGE